MPPPRSVPAEPSNALTGKRMGVTIALTLVLSAFADPGHRLAFAGGLIGLAALVSAALAFFGRERFNAPVLNRWDEMTLYLALSLLLTRIG